MTHFDSSTLEVGNNRSPDDCWPVTEDIMRVSLYSIGDTLCKLNDTGVYVGPTYIYFLSCSLEFNNDDPAAIAETEGARHRWPSLDPALDT
jgi:hypothetical protein